MRSIPVQSMIPGRHGSRDGPSRPSLIETERAMCSLPTRERLALRLLYWEAKKPDEIARILGIPSSEIGPLLNRARAVFRDALDGIPS